MGSEPTKEDSSCQEGEGNGSEGEGGEREFDIVLRVHLEQNSKAYRMRSGLVALLAKMERTMTTEKQQVKPSEALASWCHRRRIAGGSPSD